MNIHIGQRIDRHYADLSPQEQRVADFILDHFDDFAVYNAAELARLTGVSKATVSRLFKRLGFDSFREVKDHARELRSLGVPLASSSGEGGAPQGFVSHFEREQNNLRRCLDHLSESRFEAAVSLLCGARRILVLGFRNSYPIALHFRQQMIQCRTDVHLAPQPGQSLGEELAGLGSGDLVVLFGFRRRLKGFSRLLDTLAHRQVPVLLVGDATMRRHAEQANVWLEAPLDSVSAFDSYAAAMSLVCVLANGALHRQLRLGRMRIAEIGDYYEQLDELEEGAGSSVHQ
ncbi:MurR/RpiR family transcriptional regulator [Halotalea alkalilenta]|uniref:RpiR family transcriptional regulator n=1 Tax=Halotalea alkalilenta TaxID=376489 RepID=A0A172YFM9_9GAMM|nr:MurR/RpiR family transcriptional regulator [Halotalea alkalilenta]ANF58007.1 RpiR family transcriptional regulator [Halotalea alkalilenta]